MAGDLGYDVGLLVGIGLFVLLFQGVAIWFAARAKPVGNKPYRWGTYVGVLAGLIGLLFIVSPMLTVTKFSPQDTYGRVVSPIMGVSAAAASFGILRRRRFGIVMFVVAGLSIMMAAPLHEVIVKPFTAEERIGWVVSVPPVIIVWVVTNLYFKKRWGLMT